MKLDNIQIQHFRNLKNVVLDPSPSINVLVGQNGSGKSSLLEAIHYLGYGRSFRTSRHKNVVQYNHQKFTVFSKCSQDGSSINLGISRSLDDETVVSVDGNRSTRISNLVSLVPLQIFTPQSSDILVGSPKLRRRYLDWGLFHVEHSFLNLANNYTKSLKHKNALLRAGKQDLHQEGQVSYWSSEISRLGLELTSMRINYLERLKSYINSNLEQFIPEFNVEISYYRGWEKGLTLQDSILKNYEKDKKNGFTSVGCHKADLRLKINGAAVSDILSRGQLRMLMAALQLAQTQLLYTELGRTCIFLLDDIGAELDQSKRELFIDSLLESSNQLFVTAIEKKQLEFMKKYKYIKMFHVEHGQVKEEI
jgi:DNA replication and repair protein RecF